MFMNSWILPGRSMSSGGHVEFSFNYRITEFMRLIVDDLESMEDETMTEVAEWMMKKIRARVSPFTSRFSIDEEDEVEVDDITVAFLFDLLRTCQRRGCVQLVDFEMESEPRTVVWKSHSYNNEKFVRDSPKDKQLFQPADVEFDASFIEFLRKLEERQEMIKESALRLLSPSRSTGFVEQRRIEKSVQTSNSCSVLPAEVFAPELPPPDLAEFHDAPLEMENVDHFVDALFDFESNGTVIKRLSSPHYLPVRDVSWRTRNFLDCVGRQKKITMPWSMRSIQDVRTLNELASPSAVEDLIAFEDTTSIARRVQRKWDRLHGEVGLSMTAALSTGVAGLINYSKEHKSSKSAKSRHCELCRAHNTTPKSSDNEVSKEEATARVLPVEVSDSRPVIDVYKYMKKKLKEHEKAKRSEEKENEAETAVAKPKKAKKDSKTNDIRAYLVGKKVADPSCKSCGAQGDIRDYLVGKKVKQVENVEVQPSTVTASKAEESPKPRKTKSSSKSRIVGKYVKLAKTPTLAVVGESTTRFIGRLSNTETAYGKTFKFTNLSRKEIHLSLAPMDWPEHVKVLHPVSSTSLAPGQTKDVAVTITRRSAAANAASECHLLSVVHRRIPLSHVLAFKVDALAEHHEGPLLSELYTPEEVQMLSMLRPLLNMPTPKPEAQDSDEDEVDSLCTGVVAHMKVSNSVHTTVESSLKNSEESGMKQSVELKTSRTEITAEKNEEIEEAEDSSASDFELVDVDEGGSISSDKDDDEDTIA
ncbi:unnamed protein product [Nippostrongylus brasiliensis]|uniref:ULP_PROTEASE domain-containing protein n=1 Tax=Nippostrongylus brasiliensis TaxID=27835 RepID=A0A158QX07_NIPBR|nr:unnamed protein product [Nippostrongylus brasiliensis]